MEIVDFVDVANRIDKNDCFHDFCDVLVVISGGKGRKLMNNLGPYRPRFLRGFNAYVRFVYKCSGRFLQSVYEFQRVYAKIGL